MSTVRWKPLQKKTAQVDTISITAYDVATTYRVTLNGKVVGQVGTGGTTTTTAAALYALLAAMTDPEFMRITWSTSTNTVIATAKTPGTPFTLAVSVSGGTGTISLANTTANTSPNDVNDPLNWSGGALPVNGDDVLFDAGGIEQSAWWNLGALSGVTFASFTRRKGYRGRIGLPEINRDGIPYTEYLATEFAFGLQSAFNVFIEQPSTDRAEQIKINTGSTQTVLTIQGESTGAINNEACWWRGTHVSNVVNNEGGSLAIAPVAGNSAVVATLNNRGTTRAGGNVTLGVVNNLTGTLDLATGVTTLTQQSGKTTFRGNAMNVTTASIRGGTLDYRGTGTITTLTLGGGAIADFSKDNRARTVTNAINIHKGGTLLDPAATLVAGGLDIVAVGCGVSDVRLNLGTDRTLTVA